MAGRKRKSENKLVHFPESRVKTLMKSSPEVENIGKDALFLVNKATELFIQYLTKSGYSVAKDKRELHYNDIAEIVQTHDMMSFLREIMPKQITFGQYKEMMASKGIPIIYESSDEEKEEVEGSASDDSDQENSQDDVEFVEVMEQEGGQEVDQTVINDSRKQNSCKRRLSS